MTLWCQGYELLEFPAPAYRIGGRHDYTPGQLKVRLVDGEYPSGVHDMRWNVRGIHEARVSSGAYACEMEAGSYTSASALVLVH